MPDNRKPENIILIAALLSAVASFAVYLPSLGFEFVDLDDPSYVTGNPDIRGLDLKQAFTSVVVGTWVPVTFLSFTLDYAIWGLNPLGYHLTNSALHAANVFLVALLGARLAGTRGGFGARGLFLIALSAGLLFGLHPLRVESVVWISERKDVLNAFFFLLGILSYLGYAKHKKASSYILALVFFVLSLLSKPMTVTMPLVLLILDFYPFDRFRKEGWTRPVIEKLPFFMLSLATGLITVWSQSKAMVTVQELVFSGRLHVAERGYLFYIYKTLAPMDLAPLYPRNFQTGLNLHFAAYALALLAITALAVYLRRRSGVFIAVWAYFAVTLLPVIGFLQVGMQAAADRYTYIPGMGLAVLAAAGAGWAAGKNRSAFAPVLASVVAASALLSFTTLGQAGVWKDSLSLWSHQVRLFPDYAYGYVNRGAVYLAKGMYEDAIKDLDKSVSLHPSFINEIYFNRGVALVNAGRLDKGIADLTVLVDSDPESKAVYKARGTAYALAGRYVDALKDFQKAIALDPSDPSAHIDLGKVYMHLGNFERSYASMRKALELGDTSASRYISDLEARGAGQR
ncbi:MAG: tetratricopeptide repeat protein [Deltaproteobacteria bacterium]|nr:tetratricopeptide repeat protein [Deltaproteobacteria bacterium]